MQDPHDGQTTGPTPIPDWARLGHRSIIAYGAVCLVAGCVVIFRSAGSWGLLFAPLFLMTPEIVLAWLAAPLAFGLGHWIGDLVTKRQKGHIVARMLSRYAQSVHGTAIVLGTCSYFPLMLEIRQVEASTRPVLMLGMILVAQAISASAHTARRRWRALVAASFSATAYVAIGVLIGVLCGVMWMGAFAVPFAVYFAATALWLVRGPQWHDA